MALASFVFNMQQRRKKLLAYIPTRTKANIKTSTSINLDKLVNLAKLVGSRIGRFAFFTFSLHYGDGGREIFRFNIPCGIFYNLCHSYQLRHLACVICINRGISVTAAAVSFVFSWKDNVQPKK